MVLVPANMSRFSSWRDYFQKQNILKGPF